MQHEIRVIVTMDDVLQYEKSFTDPILAKLAVIKQLFKLGCPTTLSNIGEFGLGYYKTLDDPNLDLSNLPVTNQVKYCSGSFRYNRVVPDLFNLLPMMCKEIIEKKNIKVSMIAEFN